MAFQVNNPTLKNIIDFLKNQLGSMSLINDAPTDSKKYGRKNGFWVEITEGGGGGGGSNIGDNVYTEGDQLIIKSSSTQIEDFFKNIAPEFDNTVSHPINSLVLHENQLYTLTAAHTAPASWENTSHTTAVISDILNLKAPIANPTFTGTPYITTTPAENSNNHKIADTAYVDRGLQSKASITYVDEAISKMEVLKYTASSISDTNRSFNVTGLEDDMVPLVMDLSNPSAQTGGWTISTTTNNFTITGSITGNTNADFYFVKTR